VVRGKHAARKHNRDVHHLTQQVAAARAELSAEQQRFTQAQTVADHVRQLEQQLAQARHDRDAAVAGEVARLQAEIDVLTTLHAESQVFEQRIDKEWARTSDAVVELLGGGIEGFEGLMRIGFTGGRINDGPAGNQRFGGLGIERLQRAQGVRRHATAAEDANPRYLRPALRRRHQRALEDLLGTDTDLPDTASEDERVRLAELDARLGRLAHARIGDVDADTIHAFHPMQWLDAVPRGEHRATALLGAVHPASTTGTPAVAVPNPAPPPTADLHATGRQGLAAADPEDLIVGWHQALHRSAAITLASGRVRDSWAEPPRYPRPGDSVAFKHWYTLAALGHWSRLHDLTSTALEPDTLAAARAELPPAATVAVGMTAAVPFWLPPGQTAAYVDSEPLTEADLADVRLPFPQVLLTLADPIQLPALPGTPADDDRDHALTQLDRAVLAHRKLKDTPHPFHRMLQESADGKVWTGTPGLAGAIAARGAIVEAVLLLGDALGVPDDLFGWCLAVPAATGGMLGRWVLPARRSHSVFASQIMNLAAVTAWADWHSPDRELDLPHDLTDKRLQSVLSSAEFTRLEERGGAGGVRVLNVKRTTGSGDATDAVPRTVAPHVRRGHWRRQRYGPQRQQVKRVRIAAALVNAGRADMAPRVYRLPIPDND
jgi:hypothetical protein